MSASPPRPPLCHAISACRICATPITDILAFGEMPLANDLVSATGDGPAEERFPLSLAFCPGCALVQLRETVDPARLFRDYVYQSSNSPAFVGHAAALARRLIADRSLGPTSRVVEVASNDGYLLQHYRQEGVPVLGVEPARNIAEIARQRGIDTIAEFFSSNLARQLVQSGSRADVVHAHNLLAHVAEPTDVAAGIAHILKPGGIAVIEVPYLIDLVERLEFDTIYHEHLCYFALTPLLRLFDDARLQIFDVERLAVHGGSLRLFIRHRGGETARPTVAALLAEERRWGVGDVATYHRFANRVRTFAPKFRDFIGALRSQGHSIAAYGASAKGATLINYCKVGRGLIDFVVDVSKTKQGMAMPGMHIPILAPVELLTRRPDFVVLLAWNFADEIVRQQAEYLQAGGRFIVPVPEPHVL